MAPSAPRSVRVVVADDHELARAEIVALLGGAESISVVGEAVNGAGAIHVALATHAEVVLMDVMMPVVDGVTATSQLIAAHVRSGADPATRPAVVMLTGGGSAPDDQFVYEALRLGARGFVSKHARPDELVQTVHDAADPGRLVWPTETVRLIAAYTPERGDRPDLMAARASISTGDAIVVVGVARGHDDGRIARHLGVSPDEVRRRVSGVMASLGLRDRTQLVVFAHECGLVHATGRGVGATTG